MTPAGVVIVAAVFIFALIVVVSMFIDRLRKKRRAYALSLFTCIFSKPDLSIGAGAICGLATHRVACKGKYRDTKNCPFWADKVVYVDV